MKKAFTMLELILVIVIVGILSFALVNGWERNTLREAADQLVNHIRYTQHLAMQEDKFDSADVILFRERGQVRVRLLLGELGYVVFSDRDQDRNTNANEIALDPLSGEALNGFANFRKANLTTSYGITAVALTCFANDNSLVTANQGSISFDSLGRPYSGVSDATAPFQYLLGANCNIILTDNQARTVTITVQPETGYTSITAQNY